MLVAGFDVGIKNLAFCIIDSEKHKSGECGIVDWKCINLITNPGCNGIIKSGQKKGEECGKNCTFKFEDKHFCGTHKPEKAKKFKPKTCKNMTAEKLLKIMFEELDNHPIFKEVEKVVIELQPKINPKMKVISNGLQSYFILRFQIDSQNLKIVKFSSAKNKLKVYKGPQIFSPKKTGYDQRKDLAQKHTEILLEGRPELETYYFSHPQKKDDLADAYLHCVFAL